MFSLVMQQTFQVINKAGGYMAVNEVVSGLYTVDANGARFEK